MLIVVDSTLVKMSLPLDTITYRSWTESLYLRFNLFDSAYSSLQQSLVTICVVIGGVAIFFLIIENRVNEQVPFVLMAVYHHLTCYWKSAEITWNGQEPIVLPFFLTFSPEIRLSVFFLFPVHVKCHGRGWWVQLSRTACEFILRKYKPPTKSSKRSRSLDFKSKIVY